MKIKTSDLCDRYAAEIEIAEPVFNDYGGERCFSGPIATVQVFEDNVLVRKTLEEPGQGRVLVVDGGGSLRRAIIGETIAKVALTSGWAGVVIHGSIRDVDELAHVPVGVKALRAIPLRPTKEATGQRDIVVKFAGVTFRPGYYLYADTDGIVVSPRPLTLE